MHLGGWGSGRWVAAAIALAAALTLPADAGATVADDGGRCLVKLHGKSGTGGDTYVENDVAIVSPNGNAEGWGGRQWVYFPDDEYENARTIVVEAIDGAGCGEVILNGFSNGGAFAAKLYCRGETFDGRLVRVVVDDPVPDEGVLDCTPDPTVAVVLYWTGALAETARPGWDCTEGDWTCEGGVTIGIDAYAEALETDVLASPHTSHEWYWDAPELADWTRIEPADSAPATAADSEPG